MHVTRVDQPSAELSSEPVPTTFVVPLDGSPVADLALPVARVVGARFGASVRVADAPADADDPTRDDIGEFLARETGHRSDTVICLAGRGHAELPPFGQRDLADRVLERLDVPALVVGPHCSAGTFDLVGPLVVYHDGSAAGGQILGPAVAWATALEVPIHLVHVSDPFDITGSSAARANVSDAFDRLGPSAQVEWARSSLPAGAIRTLAREVDASIVAMSTHGQNASQQTPLGSVTAWVVREAFCPVLVWRPVGI